MERILLHGVPYYTDKAGKLYTYQDQPIEIGSYQKEADVVTLKSAPDTLKQQLESWRSSLAPKPRKAVSSGATKDGGEDSDDEQNHSD